LELVALVVLWRACAEGQGGVRAIDHCTPLAMWRARQLMRTAHQRTVATMVCGGVLASWLQQRNLEVQAAASSVPILRLVTAVGETTDHASSCVTADLGIGETEATVTLPSAAKKLAGCRGTPVSALLPPSVDELPLASGVFVASDGVTTEPIALAELKRVLLVHGAPDGSPLPASMGGPLRAWAPDGCAVQRSQCGTGPAPVRVKFVTELRVSSRWPARPGGG